jgi:RNA polymerase sigma-70 factor (ECF subfamily)
MLKIMTSSVGEENGAAARQQRWSAWIRLIGKGDVDAFGALYDESSPAIFPLVLQILPNRELAEDALVDIYNHVREQARRFDPRRQSALDWLIALARDFATDRLRRSSCPRGPHTIEDVFSDKRRLANLALAELSEEQRSVLEMAYLGGLTVDEVAQLLGTTRAYVAKQIAFALRTLKTCSQNLSGVTVRISNFAVANPKETKSHRYA